MCGKTHKIVIDENCYMIKNMNNQDFNEAYESLTTKKRKVLKAFLAGETEEAIAKLIGVTDSSGVRRHIAEVCGEFGFYNKRGERNRLRDDLVELFVKYKPDLVNPEVINKYLGENLPMIDLELPEGAVNLDSPFYLERSSIESSCYEEIVQPGALIRIKAPKQMGKTSLVNRILERATKQGDRTVSLNLRLANDPIFSNIEKFFRWFCASVGSELGLTNKLDEYWDEDFGSNLNCNIYFERYLLPEIETILTLGLDEVDRVFPYSNIYEDFFGLLRTWHENSKKPSIWKRFKLVMAHSTEVYIPLNINRSPFNVGLAIKLPEFNQEQVQDLAKRHGLNWKTGKESEQLISMVGGHPYLVRLALYHLGIGDISLEQLLQEAATESGIYSDHLRGHLENLENHPELANAMKQVISANEAVRLEVKQTFKLDSMGLIKRLGNDVIPSCELYRRYFCDRLEER